MLPTRPLRISIPRTRPISILRAALFGAAFLCALISIPALAQSVTVITGHVTGPGGTPLGAARVQATNDAGRSAEARSDSAGLYRLVVPGRSAAYVVSAEAMGINPVTRLVHAAPEAAEMRVDLALLSRDVPLSPIVARARRLSVAGATEDVPGATGSANSGFQLQRDPLGSDDLADLLGTAPGVARTPSAAGTGLSIAGQSPDQTRFTVDGGDASPGMVPREALRDVEVRSSPYDVGRGRFTGGQVDVRTQAAGNDWGASLRLDRRDPRLQYGDAPGPLRSRTTVSAVDAGGGGALVRDRLFVFGALSVRASEAPARVLEQASPAGLRALGVSQDSLVRFLTLTSALRPQGDGATRGSSFGTGLLRLDAVLSPAHTLTLRFNGQSSRLRDDGSGWAVAGTGSELRTRNAGAHAWLASGGARLANELRVGINRGTHTVAADDPAPTGIVSVASEAEGATSVASLRFAGSLFGPGRTRVSTFEAADQLVMTSRDRSHRGRVGGELFRQEERDFPRNSPGAFYFPSLEALHAGRPALFTRSFDAAERTASVSRAAVFADDRWRGKALDLNLGLRLERAWVARPREANPEVEQRFGVAPGVVPSHWWVSPRGGFSFATHLPWDPPGGKSSVGGGFGDFVGVVPLSSLASALAETGLSSQAELECVGASAPVPDWEAYRADAASIPMACLDGSPVLASRLAPATLFAPGFSPARVRRGSLATGGIAFRSLIWSLNATLVRGLHQPLAFDRNLRAAPAFANAAEGGRGVYVPIEAIDAATGAVPLAASRRYADLGVVREVGSDGRSRAVQLGASVFRLFGKSTVRGGYTWTDARESVGALDPPGGGEASVGTRADDRAWVPAPYAPRHVLNVSLNRLLSRDLSLGVIARLASGTSFTPMVAGDVNGDGVPNDRAFIFNPADDGLGGASRDAMRDLLGGAPGNVRACLHAQLGQIAAHNSCRTAWSPSLDVNGRLELGPRIRGDYRRRATLWIAAQNLTAGLDYVVHGPEHLHGWGQLPLVDRTLLSVRGFDPGTRRFIYDVNERFGRPVQGGVLNRIPFAISLQVRVVLGNDQVRSAGLREMSADQVAPLTPARLRVFLVQQWTNVPAEALLQDAPRRLYLTPSQAERLQAEADSVVARREPVLREMVELLTGTARYDARTIYRLAELRAQAVELRQAGADAARAVLTPEQWAKLPGSLHSFPEVFQLSPPQVLTSGDDF